MTVDAHDGTGIGVVVGPVIQYAHAGRWHGLVGHGERPEDYDRLVASWNERDGWPRWRVADASTERETGAPSEPVLEPTEWKAEDTRDLLTLARIQTERELDPEEKARMREIVKAHRFEGLSDDARRLVSTIMKQGEKT
jgi:hypothetical protein